MFRGKETGNKIIRRISAAILALVLVLTSSNADWNTIISIADWGVYEAIPSGTIIAYKHSVQNTNKINTASIRVRGEEGDEITATLVGIRKNMTYSPMDGKEIPFGGLVSVGGTTDVSYKTAPINLSNNGGTETIIFDLSKVPIVLAANENVAIMIKVESKLGYQIEVNSYSENFDGFISQNANDFSKWFEFYQMVEITQESATGDLLEAASVSTNIPEVGSSIPKTPTISLAVGQSFTIAAEVQPGYYRTIEYKEPDAGQDIYTFDRLNTTVIGKNPGTSTLTIGGDGVSPVPVTVNVIDITAASLYPYTGAPVELSLTPSMGIATAPLATDFEVRYPATNVGSYTAEIVGKSDKYPGFATTVNYNITPIDLAETDGSGDLVNEITPEDGKFYVDPSTGQVADSSKFDLTIGGNTRTFVYGTDFNATAVFKQVESDKKYTYDITITGKGNLINSQTVTFSETVNTSVLRLKDMYSVTLNQTEIIWDGSTMPIPEPQLTFVNKITGTTYTTQPGDVTVTCTNSEGSAITGTGAAKVTVTSNVYDVTPVQGMSNSGPIVLNYTIKQKIDNNTVVIELEKPSYVEEVVNGAYVERTPALKVKLISGTPTYIDPYYYDVIYSNNTRAGVATVTVVGKNDSLYSGSASTTFRILPNLEKDAWISIGGVVNHEKPNIDDYAKASNGWIAAYSATYTGDVIEVLDNQIEILIDGVVLDHRYYHVDASGYGLNANGIRDGKAGVDVGPKNGSVLIKTTEEYGEQSIRVYFTIVPCELKDVSINPVDSGKYSTARTYTGKEIKLEETQEYKDGAFTFRVTAQNGKVVDASEYVLEYRNNIDTGTATLIAVGKEGTNYTGSASVGFEILPYNISGSKFTVDPIGDQSFIGVNAKVEPKPIMYFDGTPVTNTTGFDFAYSDNEKISTATKPATITITGGGNFEGTKKVNFNIVSKSITNSSVRFIIGGAAPVPAANGRIDSSIKLDYDGGRQMPSLEIRDNGQLLTQGVDYQVRPANNINIKGGTDTNPPSMTITGIGNYGSSEGNTVLITFTIGPRSINASNVAVTIDPDTHRLTKVEDSGNKARKTLIEGVDYEVKTTGRDNDVEWDGATGGDYTMYITGIGNYTGVKEQYFTHGTNVNSLNVTIINPIQLNISKELSVTSSQIFDYLGGNRPFVKITDSVGKVVDSGFTYEFIDSNDSGPVNNPNVIGTYILRITGDGGDYFGVADFKYSESTSSFNDDYTSEGVKKSIQYKNDFAITVNGVTVDSEKEPNAKASGWYTFEFPYTEGTILKDEEISVSAIFKPFNRTTITDYIPKNLTESAVEVTISGTLDLTQETTGTTYKELIITAAPGSGFNGSKTVRYTVKKPDISGAKITGINDEYTYKAEDYTPADFPNIVVTLEGKTLARDKDYTVTVVSVNTTGGNAGSVVNVSSDDGTTPVVGAKVVITGKGEFDAATKVEKPFKIVPKNIKDTDVSVEAPSVVGKGTTAPLPTITYKDSSLTKDNDYVVTGNTTTTPGSVTMTITGKGNFTGEVKKTYTVKEAFSESTVIVDGIEDTYYIDEQGRITGSVNGNKLSTVDGGDVEVFLKDGSGNRSTPLIYGTDFTIRLNPDSFKPGRNRAITVEGINDYTGSIRYYPVTVYGKFTEANVSGLNPRIEYSGNSVKSGSIKVTFQGDELVENTHYTVEFLNEDDTPVTGDVKDVGSYKAVIRGKATSSYAGSTATIPFQITKRKTTGITVEIKPEWEYTGNPIDVSASLTVKDGDDDLVEGDDYTINGKGTGTAAELVTANLTATNPGSYTITITGKGNYEGEKSVSYNVVADINKFSSGFASDATAILTTSNGEIAIKDVVVSTATYNEVGEIESSVTYTPPSGGITPSYTVSYEGSLVPGSRGNIVVEGQAPYYKGKKTVVQNARVYGLIEEVRWMNASTETDENNNPIYAYTGSVINPITSAVFELNGTKLTTSSYSSSPITAVAPTTNTGKEVGDYRVTLKGEGYYLGSKDIVYGIRYDLAGATVTLEPTSYTYDGQAKEPKVTVKVKDKTFVNKDPGASDLGLETYFTLTFANNTNAGTATVTVSGDGNNSINAVTKTFKIDRANKANAMVLSLVDAEGTNNDEYVYTGEAIKPDVTVEVDNSLLDSTNPAHAYTVTYPANPVSVGTYKAIVELTGSYSGKSEISYKIVPKSIGTATITAEDVYYTGKKAKPVVTVTDGGNTLVEGRDYTVSIPETAVKVQPNVVVTIEGKGNYTGTLVGNGSTGGTFNILPIDVSQTGVLTVTGNSKVYDGVAVSSAALKNLIEVTVRSADGSAVKLDPNTDYEISWKNNDPVTNGNSMVSAVGHDFEITASSSNDNMSGIYTGTYVISKKQLNNDGLVYTDAATTGYKSKIGVNSTEENGIRYANKDILDNADFSISVDQDVVIKDAYLDLYDLTIGEKLYDAANPPTYPQVDVVYSGNDMAGIATVKFVAKENSNYTGEVSFRFKIGKDITGADAGVTIDPTTYVYDGLAKTPEVITFTYGGRTLDPDTDYKVSYEDNPVNVGTHYVYVRGNGKNYYGEVRKSYTITKRENSYVRAEFKEGALVDGYMWRYNGSPARPEIVVYDKEIEGKVIDPSDYTVTYSNNTAVGTASYRVSMKDSSNYVSGSISDYGSGNTFQIVASEMETDDIEIRLSGTSPYTFTGRQIKPSVSVYYNGNLISSSNYKVSYTDNIMPGTATVTVSVEGNYEGYAQKNFDIVANLASTDTIKVTAADRTWTGAAVDASGIKAYLVSTTVRELKQDEDYEVEISPVGGNWSTAIRAKAVLTGISDKIKGTRTVYFNLNKNLSPDDDPSSPGWNDPDKPGPLPDEPDEPGGNTPGGNTPGTKTSLSESNGNISAYIAPTVYNYDGKAHRPIVYVVDNKGTAATTDDYTLKVSTDNGVTGDYTVGYTNVYGPGTATLTINGINNYTGSRSFNYTIQQPSIVIRGLMAVPVSSSSIRLDWVALTGVSGYSISWMGANGTSGSATAAGSASSATITGLSPSTSYNFTVRAYNNTSSGTATTVATTLAGSGSTGSGTTGGGTTGGTTGGTVNNVTPVTGVSAGSASPGSANVYWTNPGDGTMYDIYRSTSSGSIGSLAATITRNQSIFVDQTVTSGVTYYYTIRPFRLVNGQKVYGNYSNTVSVRAR